MNGSTWSVYITCRTISHFQKIIGITHKVVDLLSVNVHSIFFHWSPDCIWIIDKLVFVFLKKSKINFVLFITYLGTIPGSVVDTLIKK